MRKVTATEKYRAVNEGQLSKANFLRDMRMAYPSVISQLNGYDTSVQILKNRGLIHEKTAIDSYDSKMELNISPDSIDRGIRYEMQARGKDASECKDIVIKNLKKDPLHYIMLVAKDSSKVDKHDKEVEVKRGSNDVDTFNGLKKADLKENKKELAKLLKEGKMSDLAEKLGVDVSRLQDAADKLREMEREEAANSADKVEAMKAVIEEEPDEVMNIDRFGKEKEDHDSNYTKVKEEEDTYEVKGHNIDEHEHMFFSLIFNKKYDDILDDYMSSDQYKEDEKQLQDKTKQSNVFDAAYSDHWEQYIKEFEANNYDSLSEKGKVEDEEDLNEDLDSFSDVIQVVGVETVEDAVKAIIRYEKDFNNGPVSVKQAQQLVADLKATDEDEHDEKITDLIVKAFNMIYYDRGVAKVYTEKKGKGTEALVKENIKSIITKILEEGNVNEAATNQLAKYAEEYASFQGMKETIIALENIVTEIESFYDKTKGKIQKIYDSIGEVRNEEGLKVGAFIAPSIENAFNRDLRPIVKAGFTKGLDVPKIKTISQAEIDALKNETPVYEQEPKRSVFSPVYENKNKSKKAKK